MAFSGSAELAVDLNFSGPEAIETDYSVVSFFSGCGGLDLGFIGGFNYRDIEAPKLRFSILAAYDNDAKCIQTYRKNIGEHAAVEDLSSVEIPKIPSADLLIGGFPCQDFSSCGPKAGLSSQRGQLYKSLIKYMKNHHPKVVVAENVPHLEKMGGGAILNQIVREMKAAGYRMEVWRLSAADYGVPQNRIRLFFVGVRRDLPGMPEQPKPTHSNNRNSINWAIDDLANILDESVPNQSQYFKASKAKKGNGQGDETNKPGMPSYTIRANAKSRVQFHHQLPRRLTVRECARLQTFPDEFVFPHSATTNVMQIGNAVPPLLANQVARAVQCYLDSLK